VQDYRVHIKHTDGHFEHVPYFSLPANDLTDVIAPSCYSCFDYPNALADLVGHSCSLKLPLSLLAQISHLTKTCYVFHMSHSNFTAAHSVYSCITREVAQASQHCTMISSHASHGVCHLMLKICQCGLCQFEVQASRLHCPAQVVGYMGVPYYNTNMTSHPQYITIRNDRGQEMLDTVKSRLEIIPTMSSGDRKPFVLQTVISDDE